MLSFTGPLINKQKNNNALILADLSYSYNAVSVFRPLSPVGSVARMQLWHRSSILL